MWGLEEVGHEEEKQQWQHHQFPEGDHTRVLSRLQPVVRFSGGAITWLACYQGDKMGTIVAASKAVQSSATSECL